MATYYWVGGSGTWDGTTTTHWASSSGGSGSAGVPTSADSVIFDTSSNSPSTAYTVTMGTGAVCFNMTMAGPTTGQVTWAGTTAMSIYGSMSLSGTSANGGINTTYTGTVTFTNVGSSSATNITTNGVSIGFPIVVNNNTGSASGGILNTVGALTSTSTLSITGTSRFSFGSGTATFASATFSTNNLLGFSGNLILNGSGTALNVTTYPSGLSSGGSPTISFTSASPKTVILPNSGQWVGPVLQQSGAGALTLNTTTGTGTFQVTNGITNTVSPTSILVTAGISLASDVTLNGTPGNLVTFSSTSAATFTLNPYNPGVQTSTYCSVSYVNATTAGGTVLWRFLNSTNGGNNTNLTFSNIYYWVGGSGTWNDTSTTNWSLTSGGSGGAGVPTSADDVIFNSASSATDYVVSGIGYECFNVTASGPASGNATITPTSLDVYGSVTLSATGLNGIYGPTFGGYGSFRNSYPITITTNGNSIFTSQMTFYSTSQVNLGSAFNTNYVYFGSTTQTFNTNGYAVTINNFLQCTPGSTPTFNFSSSTITIGGYPSYSGSLIYTFLTSSGTTINAGTSTINFTGFSNDQNFVIGFGGATYYNVNFNTGNYSNVTYNITDTGTNSFNTLTYNAASAAPSLNSLVLTGNITTTNLNWNTTGTYNNRLFLKSDTLGTQRTIAAANVVIKSMDFRDMNGTSVFGTSSYSSDTYLGDCGGNTNIVSFPAAKTVYWNLAGLQNWSATGWAPSSGGTPAAANFPLAQDTVVFNNTGSAGTVTVDANWNIGTVNMSGRTTAMTLATGTTTPTIYGSWTNGSGTTLSGTGTITFSNRAIKTINSAGVTFTQDIVIDAPSGGLQLLTNNLTTIGLDLYTGLTRGTLDLNNLSFVTRYFTSSNTNTRAIAFGTTGNITVNPGVYLAGTIFNMYLATNFTYTGTPTVTINGTGGGSNFVTFGDGGGGSITNALSFAFTGTPAANISGYCKNLDLSGVTAGGNFPSNNDSVTVYGNFKLSSATTVNASTGTMTFAATSGSQAITTNGVTVNFPIVVNAPGASISTSSAFTSTSSFSIISNSSFFPGGTFTVNSYASSSTQFVYFNYQWIITGSGACFTQTGVSAGVSYDITTPLTLTSSSPKTFAGGGSSFGRINQGGSGALTITGNNTFASITNSVQPTTITVTAGSTQTVGNLNLNGTSGNLVTLGSSASSAFTIARASPGVSTCTFCSVSYMTGNTSSSTVLWRFLNSTNGGNNTNLTFASLYYWVGGTGTWNNSNAANWSLTSGGSGSTGPPTSADDVIFDVNSNATAYTVTITGSTVSDSALCYNFSVTSGPASGTVTFNGSSGGSPSLMVFGNFTLTSSISLSFNLAYVYLLSTSAATLTSGGFGLTSTSFVMGYYPNTGGAPASNYKLGGALSCNNFYVNAGTFDTSSTENYTLTLANQFQLFDAGPGTIVNLNASTINVVWVSVLSGSITINAGTSTINLTSSSAQFDGGNRTYYIVKYSANGTLTISGSNSFNTLTNTGATTTQTFTFTAGTTQTVSNFNINGAAGRLITINSTTPGSQATLSKSTGVVAARYLSLQDSRAIGGAVWAAAFSTNVSNNTGWVFLGALTIGRGISIGPGITIG